MYEPPQQNQRKGDDGTDASYDSSALTEAAKVAVAATSTGQEGSDATESCEAQSEAAADVARAVRVADLLGLRLVGWCLSHDKVCQTTIYAFRRRDEEGGDFVGKDDHVGSVDIASHGAFSVQFAAAGII